MESSTHIHTDIQKVSTPAYRGIEAFDDVKRAIVVGAHADDMETMIGATVELLVTRGVEVYEVICTLGDLGSNEEKYTPETLAAEREEEARRGGKLLRLQQVVTLPYHDGELEPTLEVRARIAYYYRKWQPDTLFTFDPSWPGQIHPDHRAAGRVAIDALMPSKMRLYKPSQLEDAGVAGVQRAFLFSPANPSIFVDVTPAYDSKLLAACAHVSQFPHGASDLEWMRELDRAAAKRGNVQGEYAEQFSELRLW